MRQDSTYRIGAFLYDLYNKIDIGYHGSITNLQKEHKIGSGLYKVIDGWLVNQSDIDPSKWVWIGDPPSDVIIDECQKKYLKLNLERNTKYRILRDNNSQLSTLDFDTSNLSAENAEIKKRVDDAVNNMYIQLAKILTHK
jgi:hypothetical protein